MFRNIAHGWQGYQVSGFTAFRRDRRPNSPTIVQNGLQFWYDFGNGNCYPNTSTTVTDLSTTGNNGATVNTPTFSSQRGGVLNMNGSTQYVDTQIISLASAGSACIWFCKTGAGTPDGAGTEDLISNVSSDGRFGWSCGLRNNTNKIDFYIANNGNYGSEDFSTLVLTDNLWYYVCYTFDGTNKRIYINGYQDSVFASTVNGTNTSDKWRLTSSAVNRYVQCLLGHAALYNRALSASEVKLNFEATRVRYGV